MVAEMKIVIKFGLKDTPHNRSKLSNVLATGLESLPCDWECEFLDEQGFGGKT
jgi:hypothetical protein